MNQFPSLQLTVNFIKEGKQIVAYAPALDMSTVGNTQSQATKRFQEMVRIFLKDIVNRNVVDEVLTELGWKKVVTKKLQSQWLPPSVKSLDLRIPVSV